LNINFACHLIFRYSVAWYPIYRIPDGNFRAAFLTYHSLGHMVRRSAKFDISNPDACIVSPVVGLQSYNAQVSMMMLLITMSNQLHYTVSVSDIKIFCKSQSVSSNL
jgi:hypothetical protein